MKPEEIRTKQNEIAKLYYKLANMKPTKEFTLDEIQKTAYFLMDYFIELQKEQRGCKYDV